jgi:hypothetical protein
MHPSHKVATTHQHAQTKLKPSVKVEHLAHVTAASFSCSRHATCTALTDTVQSRHTPVDIHNSIRGRMFIQYR